MGIQNNPSHFDADNLPLEIELPKNTTPLYNKEVGELTVLYPYGRNANNCLMWLCHCRCGTYCGVTGRKLGNTVNQTKSCGCLRNKKIREKASIQEGDIIAGLKVLKILPQSKALVECMHCHKQYEIGQRRVRFLKENNVEDSSCGCIKGQLISKNKITDLTGQHFGAWTVLETTDIVDSSNSHGGTLHICQCDCGKIEKLSTVQLKTKKSCGCIGMNYSKGAIKIRNLLTNFQYSFIQEYSFTDLVSDKNRKLRFDFALFDEQKLFLLIEVQGRQHYEPVSIFGGEEEFEIRIRHDKRKVEYCQSHNIPLLILAQDEIEEMSEKELLERINEYGKKENYGRAN